MKKLIIAIICLAGILFSACEKKGIEVTHTENPNFSPTLLFTIDDCNVYRFEDNGYNHYIVTGKKAISVERNWTEDDTHKQEVIETK